MIGGRSVCEGCGVSNRQRVVTLRPERPEDVGPLLCDSCWAWVQVLEAVTLARYVAERERHGHRG